MRSVSYRVAGLLLPAVLFLFTTNAHAIVEPDRPVRIGEARWNVHISADFGEEVGRQLICSGALISPRIVITAAHCVIDAQSLGSWVLRIGYHALSSNEGVNRSPAAIVYHGKYERALTREVYDEDGNLLETILGDVRPGENDFDSDIAIIYLDKVARITPLRSFTCWASSFEPSSVSRHPQKASLWPARVQAFLRPTMPVAVLAASLAKSPAVVFSAVPAFSQPPSASAQNAAANTRRSIMPMAPEVDAPIDGVPHV